MKLTRHIGLEAGTGTRLALIMTILPGTEDCLVANIDRLPGDLKENFMHALSSNEGQSCINLADVLARRLYSDSGKNLLQTLHEYGYIRKLSIDAVEMSPISSMRMPLRTVLVESGILQRPFDGGASKFNPHNFNAEQANVGEALGTARNLLLEADMLETEARSKREKAYTFAPSLRPGASAAPVDNSEPIDLPFMAPPQTPVVEEPALTVDELAASFANPQS